DGDDGRLSNALYINDGLGNYNVATESGFEDDDKISYSNAVGDIENDGLQDIVVVNAENAPVSLWSNKTVTDNNWLKIKLQGTTSNRMGIGSRIKIGEDDNIYHGYTLCGEGYMNQNSSAEFFGIGQASNVDYIEIHWLSGMIDRIENITANQTITIVEGSNPLSTESFNTTNFSVYPNPATLNINFTYTSNQQIITAYIIDIQGKVIKERNLDTLDQEQRIDVSDIASGVYFLSLSEEDKTTVKKIVIQ
ncbi:T9SS type A sorting domain-containing protein, partial [Dokdonia sp.]